MNTVLILLTASILTNLLLFRWGLQERRSRRQWEQEAVVLQRALRRSHPDSPLRLWGVGLWLLGGCLLVVALLAAAI